MSLVLSRRGLLAGALAAAAPLRAWGTDPPAVVPLRQGRPHMLFEASFNGVPGLVGLDNGAMISVLDAAFADKLELAPSQVQRLIVNGEPGRRASSLTLNVGGKSLPIQPALVDLTELARASGLPLVGIVGMELFQAFAVEIAWGERQMRLHEREGYRPPRGAIAAPLRAADRGQRHSVQLQVGPGKLWAHLDLGHGGTVAVSEAIADRFGLVRGRRVSTRPSGVVQGSGTRIDVWRCSTAPVVEFAGQTLRDVPLDVIPSGTPVFGRHDGIVGVSVLNRFDLAWDLARNRLWASPNATLAAPFQFRLTGLYLRAETAGPRVIHVGAGSPAEGAGFKSGETITAVNGAAARLEDIFDAPEGRTLIIRLADGSERTLTAARYY